MSGLVLTMRSCVWPSKQKRLKEALLVLGGSFLIALAAQIRLPLTPVPITLESFAVLLLGSLYGVRLGLLTVCCYLFEGAIGLPVFAGFGSGFLYLFGPTGGYLFGFIPAVVVIGFLLERGWARSGITAFFAALCGDILLLSCGVLFLSNFIGLHQAFMLGVMPFLLIEFAKLLALSVFIPRCWK